MPLFSAIDPPQDMKKKSEKVLINRYIESKLPYDNRRTIDVITSAAKRSGVNPYLLGANALQEGMLTVFNKDYGKDNKWSKDYPISGFESYGLDTFGNMVPELKKKGYIPKDFNYNEVPFENEKGEQYTSAAFRNNEDALTAMGAMMRNFRDKVLDYSSKKKLNLTSNMQDYLTMSAYNGGIGNAMKMMDEIASGKYNQEKYISEGQTSRKGVHKNIAPRIEKQSWITEMYAPIKKGVSSMAKTIKNSIKK